MMDRGAARWNKMKQLGRNKYLLYYGVLLWGIVFTVVLGAVEFASSGTVTPTLTITRFVIFGFVGFFVGNSRWMSFERKYGSGDGSRPSSKTREPTTNASPTGKSDPSAE